MPRKPKAKREEIKVTYRLTPDVKNAVVGTAEVSSRSENLQAEYLLKLGLLSFSGIDVTQLNQQQVSEKFAEIYGETDSE